MKLSKTIIVNAGLVLLAAGCATDGSEPKDFFEKSDENRSTSKFMNAQINSGAREDATLYGSHFTGAKLNSLGTEKLTRLVPDEAGNSVKVNLDVLAGDVANQRRDAVIGFLKNAGVAEADITVKIGGNDDVKHPAAEQLRNLPKTETGSVGGAAPGGAASAGDAGGAPSVDTSVGVSSN